MKPCYNQDDEHESRGKEESCEAGESSGSEKEDASENLVSSILSVGWLSQCYVYGASFFFADI